MGSTFCRKLSPISFCFSSIFWRIALSISLLFDGILEIDQRNEWQYLKYVEWITRFEIVVKWKEIIDQDWEARGYYDSNSTGRLHLGEAFRV